MLEILEYPPHWLNGTRPLSVAAANRPRARESHGNPHRFKSGRRRVSFHDARKGTDPSSSSTAMHTGSAEEKQIPSAYYTRTGQSDTAAFRSNLQTYG